MFSNQSLAYCPGHILQRISHTHVPYRERILKRRTCDAALSILPSNRRTRSSTPYIFSHTYTYTNTHTHIRSSTRYTHTHTHTHHSHLSAAPNHPRPIHKHVCTHTYTRTQKHTPIQKQTQTRTHTASSPRTPWNSLWTTWNSFSIC
jgi:hypothetical protein